ncbi:MAG: helicase-exonuclease AddAB subunit AddB [bacterium]|nr:helicase-exonuclease AddAB subunit AddB [bacterium]
MSLQLVLGSSGAGKSHTVYQDLINESMMYPERNFIVIVPEQFTMQTQKDLVTMHPDHGILNIDILSFLRLAYRVFEETNTKNRLVLEDTGKSMILRKVIAAKREELILFQNNVRKTGFISELKSFLSELYQYSIGPEELGQITEKVKNRPMLAGKLTDMKTIYEGFKEFLSDKYITAEEILEVLCEVVGESKVIKNSVICFDGFTGFTPIQYKLVQQLMGLCERVVVTVTIDEREQIGKGSEFELFSMSKQYINKLCSLAEEANVPINKHTYVNQGKVPYRFHESEELQALEHNLFRYPYDKYEKDTDDIKLLLAKDADEEVDYTVKEIMRLTGECGYRYKDIAVVTGDIGTYGTKLYKAYDKMNIPCFLDLKKEVLGNPMVKLLRSLLELMSRDFMYESMFRYLRNDFVDMEKEDVDKLENYVLAVGIRGFSGWNKEWTRTYRSKGEIDLAYLNELRVKVVSTLTPLRELLMAKDNTVTAITTALYDFLCAHKIEEKVECYREKFEEAGEPLLAKEYKQIYGILMELFDKMVELLGDEKITCKEYKELLESGLEEAKVGLIPPGIDQIVIGDIERTRLKDIKALFFLGVNDGIIPKSAAAGGIISDMERELLVENDMEMAPTRRQNGYTEQFYLYLNLTKPTNKLYVLYSKVGNNGKAIRASYLISKLKAVFPKLPTVDLSLLQYDDSIQAILGADKGLDYMIHGLREYKESMPALWNELFAWYKKQDQYAELVELLIDGSCYEKQELSLSRAVAKALYGDSLSNSVTRLEKYAACAYAHFLMYGLNIEKRQEYQITVPDVGTIFHNTMELFAHKLHASKYGWSDVPEEIRQELVHQCVEEAAINFNNTVLLSSKRNEYMIQRVERITNRTVWALCEHVKSGDFEPKGFELQFSRLDQINSINVPLKDGSNMYLQGRIDRVDTMEDDKNVYLRIVDYKTGSTAIDMAKLYHGLQLQLVVYLNAAMELEQKQEPEKVIIPAGIFYYNIDDPLVDKKLDRFTKEKEANGGHSKEWEEEINEELLSELKLDGFVNERDEVIKAMDHAFVDPDVPLKASTKSKVIPVETTKVGAFSKRSSTVSNASFKAMCEFVMDKVKDYGNEIIDGGIKLEPYKMGTRTACDYCDYKGICGFDQKLPGSEYRKLIKYKEDEVFELMKETIKEEEGEKDE